MSKWYEESELDNNIVISSRVRLARNSKQYPFSNVINDNQSLELIKNVKDAVYNCSVPLKDHFEYINLNEKSVIEKYAMLENHTISPELLNKKRPTGILLQDDDAASILINEEDHIRIQTIYSGYNIDKAWNLADKLDDIIEESINYAFDKDYGYLTSCVTNTGTGLRASFMIHIPMLEMSGQLSNISQSINKFGMTLRGIYGESSKPLGSIYQISNQITIGKTEHEIIENLKSITNQIIESETMIKESILKNQKDEFLDRIYRSYGILSYCKKIDAMEAMKLLSDVRLGIMTGILEIPNLKTNIYNIMMNIQPGNLQKMLGKQCNEHEIDIERARFINQQLCNKTI